MKNLKKFDVLIFIAFFITAVCMCVTVIMQNSIENEIQSQATETSVTAQQSIPVVTYASTVSQTQTVSDTETEPVSYINITSTVSQTAKHTTEKETLAKSRSIDSQLIINTSTKKIHSSTCSYTNNMKEENKLVITSDELQSYLDNGYTLCSRCQGRG